LADSLACAAIAARLSQETKKRTPPRLWRAQLVIPNKMEVSPPIAEAVRLYLAGFFTFVAVFYSTRILYLKRQEADEIVHPGARFSPTWWNHMVFRLFRVAIWAVCVTRVFVPSIDPYLGPIGVLQSDAIVLTGTALLTAGFGLAMASHFALGHGWRSGFDGGGPAQLRVDGLYGVSRNPSFVGVMIAQVWILAGAGQLVLDRLLGRGGGGGRPADPFRGTPHGTGVFRRLHRIQTQSPPLDLKRGHSSLANPFEQA